MAKNDLKATDNPKLKMVAVRDGKMQSLYLDYYLGHYKEVDPTTGEVKDKVKRKRQFLGLKIYTKPTTAIEKEHNAQTILQAEMKQQEARKDYLNGIGFGFEDSKQSDWDVYSWLDYYLSKYGYADIRVMKYVIGAFRQFIAQSKEYRTHTATISPKDITPNLCEDFANWLMQTHKGEGAITYFQRFHKAIKAAKKEGLFNSDPCADVRVKADKATKQSKEVLSIAEIEQLLACQPESINADVRKAFTLTLYYGPAYCDVKKLTWANIKSVDGQKRLHYYRSKTKVGVDVILRDDIVELLGKQGKPTDKLFPNLPQSNEGANKALDQWVKVAGIDKKITWHSGRHSFCTNAMALTNDPIATAKIAGHANPQMTLNRYSHEVEGKTNALVQAMPQMPNNDNTAEQPTKQPTTIADLSPELKAELMAELKKELMAELMSK